MTARGHILRFPDDIILEILANLEGKSLLTCSTTCHRLYTLISESVLLQYKIELAACGEVDGSPLLDVAEEMRRLRLYDAAWRRLEWTGHTGLLHLADRHPPSMAAAGALAFYSTTVSHHQSLTILQHVSSKLRGVHEQHVVTPVGVGYNSLIDPSQDLLAYMPRPNPPSAPRLCHGSPAHAIHRPAPLTTHCSRPVRRDGRAHPHRGVRRLHPRGSVHTCEHRRRVL
ncbi:hypothetical protein BV25DRAFT_374031 [Artomyces pyxidatus]|uniref:Uncharacterized protein n=1 Tax=Artomyces pyxidatus TaxID=48021 RepID=A0ACB8T589_9AGAM|nr:hypothetical protein BV25DRAFT_374031 [Artomyces pyxidatus]